MFKGCTSLENLYFYTSENYLENGQTFVRNVKGEKNVFGKYITLIDDEAFMNTKGEDDNKKLDGIILDDALLKIGYKAFYNTEITNIIILANIFTKL